MLKKESSPLCFILYAFCCFTLIVCLSACTQNEQQSESRIETAIRNIESSEISIKYVSGSDESYYEMIASDELIQQLNLQSWELDKTGQASDPEEYLVFRIAEKYEIVIYSNQLGAIYDYYGSYANRDAETTFYTTTLDLQAIVDFLNQHAESRPYCNTEFEN